MAHRTCEYFRIMATAVTIITSMAQGQRKAKASFFTSEAKAKEESRRWQKRVRKEGERLSALGRFKTKSLKPSTFGAP